MKRLRRKADAMNLDSSVALDANNVMNQLQSYNPKLNNDNLIADIGAKAIIGFVDDSGQYVLEIYSFTDDTNAVVVGKVADGPSSSDLDIQVVNGIRTDVKNNILSSGYTLSNGTKLTFNNQYTSVPELEEENTNLE